MGISEYITENKYIFEILRSIIFYLFVCFICIFLINTMTTKFVMERISYDA